MEGNGMKSSMVWGSVVTILSTLWLLAAEPASESDMRATARKQHSDGNHAAAYDTLKTLIIDPQSAAEPTVDDLNIAWQCLQQLGRIDELDGLLKEAVAAHGQDWHLLTMAAEILSRTEHQGQIVAGEFSRGGRRGGGEFVTTFDRDRVQALQWLLQAMPLVQQDANPNGKAEYYLRLAEALKDNRESWKFQLLTDLNVLPDYEPGNHWWLQQRGQNRGAPVNAEGNPLFYHVPMSWADAKNDGERWRWALLQMAEADAGSLAHAKMEWARFLESQFSVSTMAGYLGNTPENTENATGPFAVHTLADNETIARLATGVKRFTLPDEFHHLAQFKEIAALKNSNWSPTAADSIAQIYENRRQYPKAAAAWQAAIDQFGAGSGRPERLKQIVGNWGEFDTNRPQPANATEPPTLTFKYRNAEQVQLTAQAIKVDLLLKDLKAYLQSSPKQLEWNELNLDNIGYRLVAENQTKYLGEQVANWSLKLEPQPNHVDRVIDVDLPFKAAGAYLVTANIADGNSSRIIVWLADTAIVKKPLDQKVWYYVADAVTGQPLPKMNVEFLGWKQQNTGRPQNFQLFLMNFAEFTDADGQIILDERRLPHEYQWLAVARNDAGRLAYLGFSGVWYGQANRELYDQRKTYLITDRPVYRPGQTVQFKFWIQQATYRQPDQSPYARQSFHVVIHNPQGEKVFEKDFTTDDYGGLNGEWPLTDEAMLGQYQLYIENHGGGSFRVEEYKKPEYEVTVDAPTEPVQLGDKITATITAKYYFGAPVAHAKVKYKVERRPHTARWYPPGKWDWFYGRGYGWLSYDYLWYPGFREWGCLRPSPWWWGRNETPPELISEQEVDIGEDGTVKVEIDTLPAKELHGDEDHSYQITAEVVDGSRRTIVGQGKVIVARKPFQISLWLNRGYCQVGDNVTAEMAAYTLDQKPVQGTGKLTLYRISYNDQGDPQEEAVSTWELNPNEEGRAGQQFAASASGQYRLSYVVTDAQGRSIEGGYVFLVRGPGFDGRQFRFNDIELITNKQEYAPGDTLKLLINTNKADTAIALFLRPTDNAYFPPKILRLTGKSGVYDVGIVPTDMPNFFIEACTIADGEYFSEQREVIVPPESRVLNVDVQTNQTEYLPGAPANVTVKLTDAAGKPFVGSTVVSVYDRSVDYIAGGSNVDDIREFFWKWRRSHSGRRETNLDWSSYNLLKPDEVGMAQLGVFGQINVIDGVKRNYRITGESLRDRAIYKRGTMAGLGEMPMMPMSAAPAGAVAESAMMMGGAMAKDASGPAESGGEMIQPTIRTQFADTAYWNAAVTTDADGFAKVEFPMPENLTAWKIRVWGMGLGAKVGESSTEVVTKKNLLIRMQAPRFFVETDEVVLSANIHNYLDADKAVQAVLELDDGCLLSLSDAQQNVVVSAKGEMRVDWRVNVLKEGTATVRMKALTDVESDAMQMTFPVYVHGMLKTESFSNALRPNEATGTVSFTIPEERRINDSRIEARFSPTLAGAMVDALPYLVEYPYGCTEQTLNRFLPTVITQRILQRMQLDLKAIQEKRTNLNAQEIGDAAERAAQWKHYQRNPVFDEAEVTTMVKDGLERLTSMQLSDGGWGWFSGFGEQSYPHTTATVVHGLQSAQQNEVALVPGVLERGIEWLKRYQAEQVQKLKNAPTQTKPWKTHADALDALIYMNLVEADVANDDMREFLYRDRQELPVYAKALFGLALHKQQQAEQLAMILENIAQYVVEDNENQTAYLRLPENNWWWYWYGSDIEANAYYLKLLTAVDPQDARASKLVKYLLNNRKHASYWNSTRDTALCIEALAGYLVASGEDKPDMTVEIWLDGQKQKEVKINAENLFTFDNTFLLTGDAVTSGEHTLRFRKTGTGPLYFNTYVINFTQEDFITKAGLEVKVDRKFYKLTRVDKQVDVSGSRGQAAQQAVEKFERTELPNLSEVTSGDLVEVEFEIDSKNDYEYILFEDMKAGGFEPVDLRSGYTGNALRAYVEFRDERTAFFVRSLPRGKHSISYRLRAEIPGQFSALPAKASGMYAPELRGNSDEMKIEINDR
ncbi:alpha-2-macroglobulin [bacterium]|nr:alpha-2-macroglobulin [bacterium]